MVREVRFNATITEDGCIPVPPEAAGQVPKGAAVYVLIAGDGEIDDATLEAARKRFAERCLARNAGLPPPPDEAA
jgi:hypothetical protein